MSIFRSSHKCSTLGRFASYFSIVILFATGITFSSVANAATELSEQASEAAQQTQSLVAMAKQFRQAGAADKEDLLEDLIALAKERQQIFSQLAHEDPGAALRAALPQHVIARLPVAVQGLMEREVELEGKLFAVIEHGASGSRTKHYFRDDIQTLRPVLFDMAPAGIDPDSRVRVRGMQLGVNAGEEPGDATVVAYSGEAGLQYLAGDGSDSGSQTGGVMGEVVNPIGEQQTLVMLVNFQDTADQTPFTIVDAQSAIFGTVNDFFYEASYGKTWLTGDVHGWYTLPITSTCNTIDISNAADAAVAAAGVDLSIYGRLIYVINGSASCFWSGASNMWVYPSRAWMNGNLDLQVIAHELGHGFGLQHSNFLDCGDQVLGSDCTTARDDKFDTMGAAPEPGHFNVFQKERLGWITSGEITTVSAGGSHTLEPLELSGGTKAIKVLKEQDPAGQGATWFYLEFRQALGFDAFIAGNDNVLNGVLIRTASDFDSASSLLLDTTPASSIHSFYDRSDPALVAGESFTDPGTGITISTTSVDAFGATVSIALGAPACVRAAPNVVLSQAQSQAVAPGTTVSYDVIITNSDNDACAGSSFYLSQTVPQGWAAALASDVLIAAPGGSAATMLTVTSSTDAVDGVYDIQVAATNNGEPAFTANDASVYSVSNAAANQAPTAIDDTATTSIDTPVIVDVLANDTDADGDALSIANVASAANGAVIVNANGSVTYTPSRRFKGTDSFSYTVSDGLDTATAIATVTVRRSSGGGGGGKGKKP